MLSRLLLLFIVVPVLELILLIQMGQWIGTLPTVALIFVTGVVGAWLARQQGLQTLARLQSEMQQGQMPTGALFDGALILVAGAVLMTPGVLTDVFGFLLLIPASRKVLRRLAWKQVERMMANGQIRVSGFGGGVRPERPEKRPNVIIIDPDDESPS